MQLKSILACAALCLICFISNATATMPDIPSTFDSIGPVMRDFTTASGRQLVYIDEGEADWRPVVFFGGAGTSVQAFHLTEFNRTLRQRLKLRVISLERNGYGQTPFVPGLGFAEYAADLRELLNQLGVDTFTAIAISGGGPYMSHAADLMPQRVVSLHFAAAVSFPEAGQESRAKSCADMQADPAAYAEKMAAWVQNPMVWWDLGKNTSINHIPGFQDAANNEGAHCFFIRGQMGNPEAALHEYALYCQPGPHTATPVKAPVFLYYGEADKTVTLQHAAYWQKRYANSQQTLRSYPNEGHDVQYRHWEQILLDMAGFGDQVLICRDGQATMTNPAQAETLVRAGTAVYGSCAWAR